MILHAGHARHATHTWFLLLLSFDLLVGSIPRCFVKLFSTFSLANKSHRYINIVIYAYSMFTIILNLPILHSRVHWDDDAYVWVPAFVDTISTRMRDCSFYVSGLVTALLRCTSENTYAYFSLSLVVNRCHPEQSLMAAFNIIWGMPRCMHNFSSMSIIRWASEISHLASKHGELCCDSYLCQLV